MSELLEAFLCYPHFLDYGATKEYKRVNRGPRCQFVGCHKQAKYIIGVEVNPQPKGDGE